MCAVELTPSATTTVPSSRACAREADALCCFARAHAVAVCPHYLSAAKCTLLFLHKKENTLWSKKCVSTHTHFMSLPRCLCTSIVVVVDDAAAAVSCCQAFYMCIARDGVCISLSLSLESTLGNNKFSKCASTVFFRIEIRNTHRTQQYFVLVLQATRTKKPCCAPGSSSSSF